MREALILFLRGNCLGNFYSLQTKYFAWYYSGNASTPEFTTFQGNSCKNLITCKNDGYYLKLLSLFSERYETTAFLKLITVTEAVYSFQ